MRDSFHGGEGVPREKPPDGYAREIRAEIGERGCFGDWRLCGEGLENAWRPTNWEEKTAEVKTMYKRKDKKVLPANVPLSGGVNPGGGVSGSVPVMEGEMGSKGDVGETHGGKKVPRGSRLTPERLAQMKIGDGFLSEEERMLFVDILYEFEGVLAFEDSEMGCLHESIEPPVVVHTVPHVPWQQRNLRLPKAMQEAAMKIIQEKLENGTLEYSQGPYHSRYFLVAKKKAGEWRFINDVQPMNKITIRDVGMPPSVDEFSEDFAGNRLKQFYSHDEPDEVEGEQERLREKGWWQMCLERSWRDSARSNCSSNSSPCCGAQ